MQTRSQTYAAKVYELLKDRTLKDDEPQKYKAQVLQLPALIRTAGLAQALAFYLRAKDPDSQNSRDATNDIVKDIAILLKARAGGIERLTAVSDAERTAAARELVAKSRSASLREYMHLTQDVLDVLLWLRRYAQAEYGG